MTFHRVPPGADTPPELAALFGVSPPSALCSGGSFTCLGLSELGIAPLFLLAGGAAAGASILAWLNNTEWTVDEYNQWMLTMNNTIHDWDQRGWKSGCWQKYGARRKAWLNFWKRFSLHYGLHGRIGQYSFVSDREERPSRILMKELKNWGKWLNTACKVDTGASALDPGAGAPPPSPIADTDWAGVIKWGALGLGALVALNVATGLRDMRR